MFNLDYKNWNISIIFNVRDNKSVSCAIRSERFGKSFLLTKKCSKDTYKSVEHYYSLFGHTEVEHRNDITYRENETISDLIDEAKAIVDMFEKMENFLTETIERRLMNIKFSQGELELLWTKKL